MRNIICKNRIEGVKKSKWTCVREDGRDLTMEWKANKEKEGVEYAFVRDTKELRNVDTGNIDYLLGRLHPIICNISYKVENEFKNTSKENRTVKIQIVI